MLSVNCFLKNTIAVNHIRDAIQIIVAERVEKGQAAKFPTIYKIIKQAGVEADAESVGSIYDTLYGDMEHDALSTTDEVYNYSGIAYNNEQQRLVNDVLGETPTPEEQKIGSTSPEKFDAMQISKLFRKATYGTNEKTRSIQKQMQDMVLKSAMAALPPNANKPQGMGLTEALYAFFDLEDNRFRRLDGKVNTMETLRDELKKQVEAFVEKAAENLDDHEAAVLREQWEKYTEAFMNSAYDIVLSKANQKSLVIESLKQGKFEGVNPVDVNGNINWSALLEHEDPDSITANVKQLFLDGIKNKDNTISNFTEQQADRIASVFRRLYQEKLDAAEERAINLGRLNNTSARNILSDFIKDRGFFTLVKDKAGHLLLSKTDWDNLMDTIRDHVKDTSKGKDKLDNEIRSMDLIKNKLREFLDSKYHGKVTEEQIKIIEDLFVSKAIAKLTTASPAASAIQRLIALRKINVSNAFNAQTQQAVNKVVGVSGLSQQTLNRLHSLTKLAQSVLQGNVTPGAPNNAVNRASYAFTALAEIDRRIKEILYEYKTDKSTQQALVKYIGDMLGAGTSSLLINPGNLLENVNTGTFTNLGETVNLLFTHPKLFWKNIFGIHKNYWSQWLNQVQGGAAPEIHTESDLSSNDLPSGERLRVRGILNQFKNKDAKGKIAALGSVTARSIPYAINIFQRMANNSIDAATHTAIMRKKLLASTYKALRNQGNSSEETLKMMDEVWNIPDSVKNEIDVENKRIQRLMENAGIHTTDAMMRQNALDMRLSAYEDVMRDAAQKKGATVKQAADVTKTLINAAQTQAKVLTGKRASLSNDWLTQAIRAVVAQGVLIPQQKIFERAKEAEREGDLNKAAWIELKGRFVQNFIGKFVGSVANFMNLAISFSPFGGLAVNSLYNQQEKLKDEGKAALFGGNLDDLQKYTELQGMMRSYATRSILGTIMMAGYLLKEFTDDDDDKEKEEDNWLENLMQTKTGRRFIQKQFPLMIAFLSTLFHKDTTSKKKKKADDMLDSVLDMLETYAGTDMSTYANFRKSMQYAKNDEERAIVYSKTAGNFLTSLNANQAEQIIKFRHAVQSMFNKKNIENVQEDEEITKEIYKSIKTNLDAFLVNGAIDLFRRNDKVRYDEESRSRSSGSSPQNGKLPHYNVPRYSTK